VTMGIKFEEQVKWFNRSVPRAAKLNPLTWCVKRQGMIRTISLKGEICCACPEFVLNKGVCDPL